MTIYQRVPAGFANLSKNEKWCLLGIMIVGSLIRIVYCWDKPYLGDEVGTLMFIKKDISYLLSHFATWLGMNYFIALEKIISNLLGENALGLRLVPMMTGIAIIPLTALLAINFTSPRTAMAAAALTSLNPYLIMFSGTIRAYSLLMAFSLALLLAFVRWYDSPTFRRGIAVAVVAYLLILTHPNGVYSLACLFLAMAAEIINPSRRPAALRKLPTFLIPITFSMVMVMISYAKIFPEMIEFGAAWHDTPPTGIGYIPHAFSLYFSGGFYGWLSAFCFLSGLLVAYKHEKPVLLLAPCIFLPILLMSLQGSSTFPWAYARFISFIVPIIIIFISEGVEYFASRFFPARAFRFSVLAMFILVLSWLPEAKAIVLKNTDHPWHHAAAFLQAHVRPGDMVLGSCPLDAFHLIPYFPEPREVGLGELNQGVLKHDSLKSDSATLYFVSSDQPVKTESASKNFGKVQVIIYTPSGREAALGRLRKDLLGTVSDGKELGPEFASLYKNIWHINNALGVETGRGNFYYYNLWIKCFELTQRQRNIPFNLQKWEAQRFLKGMK